MKKELIELRSYLQSLPRLADTGREKRIKQALKDFRYFVITYFAHHIGDGAVTDKSIFRNFIYKNIDKLTSKNDKLLFLSYRGSAKTTLISKLYSLYKIANRDINYEVIISSNQEIASEVLETIKIECEDNINFREDFNIKIGSTWQSDEIVIVANENKIKVRAVGITQKIRGLNFLGKRPDLIILDDCENDENVKSKNQRDKLDQLFNKAILKLPDRKSKYNIIVVGTMLHYDALLARIKKRVDFKQFNFPLVIKYPANIDNLTDKNISTVVKDAVLDDDDIDKYNIFQDFLSDKQSFYSEYQNEPLADDSLLFTGYKLYNKLPEKIDYIYLGIDPALGKNKGDYFAIAKLLYNKETNRYFTSARGFKTQPDKMIEFISLECNEILKMGIPFKIAIETVQFQEFFAKTLLKEAGRKFDISLPIVELKNTVAKELRIDSLAPYINNETLLIDEGSHLLIEELLTYPKSAHDDLLDSVEMAFRIANRKKELDYNRIERVMRENNFKFRGRFI